MLSHYWWTKKKFVFSFFCMHQLCACKASEALVEKSCPALKVLYFTLLDFT